MLPSMPVKVPTWVRRTVMTGSRDEERHARKREITGLRMRAQVAHMDRVGRVMLLSRRVRED
jgi:hypothetical protein